MSKPAIPKSRLGRGLSSLINVSSSGAAPADLPGEGSSAPAAPLPGPPRGAYVLELPLAQLSPNPHQPRRTFDEASLKELADSIRTTGLIQPVVARGTDDGSYELIAGERRWRAAKLAGLDVIPVIVRSVDPVMQAQMALIENIQRQDLNPVDRAMAYQALVSNLGLTQSELADRLGEDRSVIGHHLRLLDLGPAVQEMVADGRLSVSHGKLLAGVSDVSEQARLAELAVAQALNVRNLERLINAPGAPATAAPDSKPPSPHLADLEKVLSRQLGMRVQVKASPKKGRGRLVLHYGNLDQFDDLMSRLGVRSE
jgi:ParB family chromosome partitioning protein